MTMMLVRFCPVSLSRSWGKLFLALLLALSSTSTFAKIYPAEHSRIDKFFPQATVSAVAGPYHVKTLIRDNKPIGYAFQTIAVVNIPAYSGKPINMQVLLDPKGVIVDAYVLEHHEPILLVGIPEEKLHEFSAKYRGVGADQRVVVGYSSDPDVVTVDAVTGATVTVMVVNEIVMRAAHKVALSLGLVKEQGGARPKPALVRSDLYEPLDWVALTGNGAIRRLHLTRGQVDEAFKGTGAEGIGTAPAEQVNDPFIDLYITHLNPPTIGRNLLGDKQYQALMLALKPGEQAIAVLGSGEYSFKGSGYVRGGIFDRVQLRQFGDTISFRDLDFQRLDDVYVRGMPKFGEMAIFTIRAHSVFDPGSPWSLELLVRRQTGPIKSVFSSFELPYQLPEQYFIRSLPTPEEIAAAEEAARPLWAKVWHQKSMQIGVIVVALLLLTAILFFQDRFTRRPHFLHWLRHGYLLFTVIYLGWYLLGREFR